MRQIDTATSTTTKPTPPAEGSAGWFQDNELSGGTIVPAWFLNSLQDEAINVIDGAGLTPEKDDDTQLYQAIALMINALDTEYIAIASGTIALTQDSTGTYNYVIADFAGAGLDTDNIRTLHVECICTTTASSSFVYADFDGTQSVICKSRATGGDDYTGTALVANIPINPGQSSIDLRINIQNQTSADEASFKIIGATQRVVL